MLRFPCPKDVDPADYRRRADLLARDCADLAPGLLRKACDLTARRSRFMPYAAEIRDAAREIVEERQQIRERADAEANPERATDHRLHEWARQQNLVAETKGFKTRIAIVGGKTEIVDYLVPVLGPNDCGGSKVVDWQQNPEVRMLPDGTVQQAFWSDRRKEWIFADGAPVRREDFGGMREAAE